MRKDDYVSFDLAKTLKEKGFDYPCYMYYTSVGEMESTKVQVNHNFGSDISCPTLYEVQTWLRREHLLYTTIIGYYIYYDIGDGELRDEQPQYKFVIHEDTTCDFQEVVKSEYGYDTYEEAVIAGINESMKRVCV